MWPFRRRRSEPARPVLTNDTYAKWLRAMRPPMDLFLGLAEIEQETLSMLGDAYVQDVSVAIGYAVADPRMADAGLAAANGDVSGEAELARRVAAKILDRLGGRTVEAEGDQNAGGEAPEAPPLPSFAGFGQRMAKREEARKSAPRRSGLFAGMPDDRGAP